MPRVEKSLRDDTADPIRRCCRLKRSRSTGVIVTGPGDEGPLRHFSHFKRMGGYVRSWWEPTSELGRWGRRLEHKPTLWQRYRGNFLHERLGTEAA